MYKESLDTDHCIIENYGTMQKVVGLIATHSNGQAYTNWFCAWDLNVNANCACQIAWKAVFLRSVLYLVN